MVIWKKITWNQKYSVSNCGVVRNDCTGHIFIGNKIKGGYIQLTLGGRLNKRMVLLHRVVAEMFLPNPKELREVNHIDCNKENNNVSNLEWCSRKENMEHASRNGMMIKRNLGGKNGNSKLTDEDVREMLDSGITAVEASKKYGISYQNARYIIRGDTWKHVKRTVKYA